LEAQKGFGECTRPWKAGEELLIEVVVLEVVAAGAIAAVRPTAATAAAVIEAMRRFVFKVSPVVLVCWD